jgi:hypothetical protein
MKRITTTVLAILISANTFANTQSFSLNNNANQLKSLGATFKPHSSATPKIDSHDIMMGYTGQDITKNPFIA